MKITELRISNIRSHRATKIPMERITMIQGGNHAGKSTIENAIQFALAGNCDVTGPGGKGLADLLSTGAPQGAVGMDIDEGVTQRLSLMARLVKSGRSVTAEDRDNPDWGAGGFVQMLSHRAETLACLSNTRYFMEMKPADQKTILAGIILPLTYEWPASILADLQTVGMILDTERKPFDVIEETYKAVFAERTAVNRDLKNLHEPEQAPTEKPDIAKIKEKLEELRTQATNLKLQNERAESFNREHAGKLRAAKERIEGLDSRQQREMADLEQLGAHVLSAKDLKAQQKIAAGAERAKTLDTLITEQKAILNTYQSEREKVLALAGTPKCPSCSQELSEHVLKLVLHAIEEKIGTARVALDAAYDERKALGDVDGAAKKIADHEGAGKDVKRIQNRIAELAIEFKAAQADREALEMVPAMDIANIDGPLAAIEARITNGTAVLQAATLAIEKEKAHASYTERKHALTKKSFALDRLVNDFGPKGIKADLIAQHIGEFEKFINDVLGAWEYQCKLELEPYGFQVRYRGGDWLQLHQLSRSERHRFGIAFQVALATVTGFRFVVVDEADMLDSDAKSNLIRLLGRSSLDQAIILSTEDTPIKIQKPGTAFIYLTQNSKDETVVDVVAITPLAQVPQEVAQ